MKSLKVSINYKVPSWQFCNYDTGLSISKCVCRFCVKNKGNYSCLLYDTPLKSDGTLVDKNRQCCKNTAGFGIEITEAEAPTIKPTDLIRHTIVQYNKVTNSLLQQGYPRNLAEEAAKQYILEGGDKND